jgi:hypothetical protein
MFDVVGEGVLSDAWKLELFGLMALSPMPDAADVSMALSVSVVLQVPEKLTLAWCVCAGKVRRVPVFLGRIEHACQPSREFLRGWPLLLLFHGTSRWIRIKPGFQVMQIRVIDALVDATMTLVPRTPRKGAGPDADNVFREIEIIQWRNILPKRTVVTIIDFAVSPDAVILSMNTSNWS